MVQPSVRKFDKLGMHFPFYIDLLFQEIHPKIHWQKYKNTYVQVYLFQ